VTDNVYLWKIVMLKALQIGHAHSNQLAMNSIMMLEQWFNALPMTMTVDLYKDILPKLSDFLHIEDEKTQKKAAKAGKTNEDFQFQEMLKSGNDNSQIDRKDIASKVLDLLGKIGGHAH
jgi:murein L,D-transpeptidase YafK